MPIGKIRNKKIESQGTYVVEWAPISPEDTNATVF
jgi:hypothetical protein